MRDSAFGAEELIKGLPETGWMTDAELVGRMQRGDREALGVFYARYLPTVWRLVYARLGGQEAAVRDVVSETFLAALDGVAGLDLAKGTVGGWLVGIARHKLADWQRKNAGGGAEAAAGAAGPGAEPVWQLEQAELRAAVGEVMAELEEEQRLVLEWKYLEGLSVREMAARLGRTEKGVEGLLYRARGEFRARFQARQEHPRRSER